MLCYAVLLWTGGLSWARVFMPWKMSLPAGDRNMQQHGRTDVHTQTHLHRLLSFAEEGCWKFTLLLLRLLQHLTCMHTSLVSSLSLSLYIYIEDPMRNEPCMHEATSSSSQCVRRFYAISQAGCSSVYTSERMFMYACMHAYIHIARHSFWYCFWSAERERERKRRLPPAKHHSSSERESGSSKQYTAKAWFARFALRWSWRRRRRRSSPTSWVVYLFKAIEP